MRSFMPAPVRRHLPGPFRSAPLPVVLLVVLLLGAALPAAADPPARPTADTVAGAGPVKPGYSRLVDFSAALQPAAAGGDAPRAVFVRLAVLGAAQLWTTTISAHGTAAAVTAVMAQRRVVAALAARTVAAAPAATVLFTVTDVVPGIGLLATPATLRVLAGQPGVGQISAIVPKVPVPVVGPGSTPPSADPLTDSLTGAGVRVGIIDTGIDDTRPAFGGSPTAAPGAVGGAGTTGATGTAGTAGWQPTARVVGGHDFVGDSYSAAPSTASGQNAAYQPIPRPDSDPTDCNGHGTRVAAALAGSGVADARPAGGNAPRPDQRQLTDLPTGVAPRASLYAFKVFGCAGATDAVIPALDRAVDPNQDGNLSDRLDVVDLSLTSATAAADDPETDVLDELTRFGVLPVVAAGRGGVNGASSFGPGRRVLTVAGVEADPTAASVGSADITASSGAEPTAVVAGMAALIRQRRPAWTPEQVKAALIDTALIDTDGPSVSGPVPGTSTTAPEGRGTAGPVDLPAALSAGVLAYSSTAPGAVSVSFGLVEADVRQQQVVATAAVVVQNTGADPARMSLGYSASVGQPGVSFRVSPATMVLQPGDSTLATVTMTIAPGGLRRTSADGSSPQQRNPLTGLDEARQFIAATTGRLLLVSAADSIQLPVAAAVRPVSSTSAADGTSAGAPAVVLTGTGFSLSAPGDAGSAGQQSLMSVLELGYRSPKLRTCRAATTTDPAAPACSAGGAQPDLQAVGVGRTPPIGDDPGRLWFGVASYQNLAGVGRDVLPTIDIDVNGDNTADYTLQVQAVAGTDLLYALLFDDRPATATLTAIYPVNFNLGDVDTDATDSTVLLVPVDPAALGYRAGERTYPIRYSVTLYSAAGATQNAMAADVTPALDYDLAAPGLTTAAPLWQDQGATAVPYRLAPGGAGVDALVLHLHGADGRRAQVLRLAG